MPRISYGRTGQYHIPLAYRKQPRIFFARKLADMLYKLGAINTWQRTAFTLNLGNRGKDLSDFPRKPAREKV